MLVELLALFGVGKLVYWSFGGGIPKKSRIVLQAKRDFEAGKITEKEYNDIWWKNMMPK